MDAIRASGSKDTYRCTDMLLSILLIVLLQYQPTQATAGLLAKYS